MGRVELPWLALGGGRVRVRVRVGLGLGLGVGLGLEAVAGLGRRAALASPGRRVAPRGWWMATLGYSLREGGLGWG